MTARAPAHEFRISPTADIGGELGRIAQAEIDFARAMASEFLTDPVEPIHQFRKAIKRLRALVRLGKAEDANTARQIDRMLRDIGRLLCDARDAEVIKQTAIKLGAPGEAGMPAGLGFVQRVIAPDRSVVRAITIRLDQVQDELDRFIAGIAWSNDRIGAAVEHEIANAAREMQRFSASGHDDAAHDWRKRVQRCVNQLRLTGDIVPILTVEQLDTLNRTAELLGDYNDLTVLRRALESSPSATRQRSNARLRKKARRRQHEFRRRALESGAFIGT